MQFDLKKYWIHVLVVVSIINVALFVVLFIRTDQLEKEHISIQSIEKSMNELLDERFEQEHESNQVGALNFEQELDQLKEDFALMSNYDMGDINARLSRLEIIGNIWTESEINQKEVKIVYGKVVNKDYYQQLKAGVPIVAEGSDEEITYQLSDDYQSYAVGQYGLVSLGQHSSASDENEKFIQSVVLDDDFECTYIIINDEIKYIIMGSFPE